MSRLNYLFITNNKSLTHLSKEVIHCPINRNTIKIIRKKNNEITCTKLAPGSGLIWDVRGRGEPPERRGPVVHFAFSCYEGCEGGETVADEVFRSAQHSQVQLRKPRVLVNHPHLHKATQSEKKCGDLYSAYPALLGGSRRWDQFVTQVTRQTGNHNGHSRTASSCSQQQVRTKSRHCHRWGSNLKPLAR
jgi:hypothetical protein